MIELAINRKTASLLGLDIPLVVVKARSRKSPASFDDRADAGSYSIDALLYSHGPRTTRQGIS
jgi:hypothetical protein